MEATVEINGQPHLVDGDLYKAGSRDGWLAVDQWTKISCDVLHVFYPRKYGIEKTHFYRLREGEKWIVREEFIQGLSPDEIKDRDINRRRVSQSESRNKWEPAPGYGPDWIDW